MKLFYITDNIKKNNSSLNGIYVIAKDRNRALKIAKEKLEILTEESGLKFYNNLKSKIMHKDLTEEWSSDIIELI
jgi:hypothetical protein